ncbi:MAG TPA: rhodoquinone biosynthesis methyltransferase RquA [Rhizomicrobium sp.]
MFQSIDETGPLQRVEGDTLSAGDIRIPDYLRRHYWWAYIHPRGVKFFDRRWIVNLILLGNYNRLRDRALAEFGKAASGNILQLACVYGDLTTQLEKRVAAGSGSLDVIDIVPIQLSNLKKKLPGLTRTRLLRMDSADLALPDASYDRVMLFFLLHEQPASHRTRTLREAFRVVRPGGKIMIVDFARPHWWNPLFYLWRPLLAVLEPFALDLWHSDIASLLPVRWNKLRRETFFGGFFQKVVVTR